MPVINGLHNHEFLISMTVCISQKRSCSKYLSAHQKHGSHVPGVFTTAKLKAIFSSMLRVCACTRAHTHIQANAQAILHNFMSRFRNWSQYMTRISYIYHTV